MLETLRMSWKVMLRHWAVYRKNLFSNVIPTLTDPAFFLLVFGYWVGSRVSEMNGMSYARYLAPGMVLTTCLYTAFFEASYGFFVRLEFQNVYQAMTTTPVGPREILMGEFFWLALKGAVMSTLTATILSIAGLVNLHYLWLVPLMGAMVGVGCGAIGLFASALVRNVDQFQTVYALVISPMFFVSGIFFPVDQLPQWIQTICFLSPFYHGVLIGQATLWGKNLLNTWIIHGSALAVLCIILSSLAVWKLSPKLER